MHFKPSIDFLGDDTVFIRRVQLMDRDTIYRSVQRSLPELAQWFPWAGGGYSLSDASDWLARAWMGWGEGRSFEFMVTHPEDGRMLGLCGLNEVDGGLGRANLGYWICTSEAGNGYGTAAARLAAQFGFVELDLNRIRLFHGVGNVASQRVAEKVGFQLEGRQRSRILLNGQWEDCLLYGLLDLSEIRPG